MQRMRMEDGSILYAEHDRPAGNSGYHRIIYERKRGGALTLMARDYKDPQIVCAQNTGRGWWNEGETSATIRTPSGGGDGAINANLVVYDARGNGGGGNRAYSDRRP